MSAELVRENGANFAEKNRQFVAKWKHRLCGTVKTYKEDSLLYSDGWASCGNGSHMEISGIHEDWYDTLDQYLTELAIRVPEFKIFQLKLKFGGIRLYLRNVSREEEIKADNLGLYDEDLIW